MARMKDPDLARAIGERVAEAMEWACVNQAELARRIGSYHGEVSNLVHGKTLPNLAYLKRVADALGVRLKDLVDPDPEPPE